MINPANFMHKFQTKFLPKLEQRLEDDPKKRGGRIIAVQPGPTGIDVVIEDKNGVQSTWNVDPINEAFYPVFYS